MTEPIADASSLTGTPAGGISRRLFLAGLPLVLAGCQSSPNPTPPIATVALADGRSSVSMYAAIAGEPFPVPAVNLTGIDPAYYRRTVMLPAAIRAEPGTIVVDPGNRFLYLVRDDGRSAIRYGIGVGREGFAWNGDATINAKREWPKWFPPPEMVARDPRAAPWASGMPGGPDNPLGARALYLYEGNVDTLYRIHGTNEPRSIGRAVSSGCIRMLNQDVIDLFERVPLGTKVIVLPA